MIWTLKTFVVTFTLCFYAHRPVILEKIYLKGSETGLGLRSADGDISRLTPWILDCNIISQHLAWFRSPDLIYGDHTEPILVSVR